MNNELKYQAKDIVSIWEDVSHDYDMRKYWELPENLANLRELLLNIGDLRDKNIIEVGSGSGLTTFALAKKGAKCAFLDISPTSLEIVKNYFSSSGLPEPECYNEDALNNSVPSDKFDFVWNGGVIEHFYDEGKKKLIIEMVRMARPGGKIVIMLPNSRCIQFQIAQAWKKLRKSWRYGYEDDMSPIRLGNMCTGLGLKVITSYSFNPVLGWREYPIINKLIKILGWENLEYHKKHSRFGFITVVVIQKS
jgi:2-polyprenyl-3-methyl-5-hydroxy-6-metoxy-1,4-benzoquinol methylase